MVAITGVSGSGKSTLLHDVLYPALAARSEAGVMARHRRDARRWTRLEGAEYLDEDVLVDQSPIGRTPRSNPVTYIKAFDAIRELFASLPEAQKRGLTRGTLFVQCSRRPLRDLPGRWHGDRRNAVSGRRGIGLRRVQGHALQAAGTGRAISRQEYS